VFHVIDCGEAVRKQRMPSNLLGPLITSKTRLKLLLRFFINQDVSGYLQGLSKELEENSNSVRVELNRLEQAGMLTSEAEGRKKLYRVNKSHPLTSDLTSMLRKVTGIDGLVERVVERIGQQLEQVWICGKLARGLNSDTLEVVLIGANLDQDYIANLMTKAAQAIEKEINYSIAPSMPEQSKPNCLLVWQKPKEK
jgi:DNA-binding transcriptional ArsR family regulator